MIAKICYIAKNTGIEKIEILAMHSNFRYIAKIRYDSEISLSKRNVQHSEFWHYSSLATVPLVSASFFFYFLHFFPLGL